MKKFNLKSLGCKQNILEGQIIIDELETMGYVFEKSPKHADIFILNSCAVTEHTVSEINYILNHIKKQNDDIKIILTGCLAQTLSAHESFDTSSVDLILGNSEKMNIKNYINNLFYNEVSNENEKNRKRFTKDIFELKEFQNKFLQNPKSTRVSIKIQDGCSNRCSYCIIPYARGNSRSNSIENILKQIDIVQSKGIKEIVLTGIHIGQWGKEFNKTLIDLLKEIENSKIFRYRLGSLYINEITDEMIEFLKNSKKFCPHFHLSLQSMCNKTLQNMNRFYTVEEVRTIIEKLHSNFNLPFLGCDIIAGFPQESEEDFEETFSNLKSLELSSIHAFPFSRRKNTPAYSMEGQIQDNIKSKRAELLRELSKELYKNFVEKNKLKDEKTEILIEKKSPKTNLYSAITRNYIKIKFKSEDDNLRHSIKYIDLKKYL